MQKRSDSSAEKHKKKVTDAYGAFGAHEISGISTKSVRVFLNGKVARTINSTARSISKTSTRTFGCMVMSFGLLSLFLHLFEYYFANNPSVQPSSLIIGAVFAILAIPMVVVDIPACDALQGFAPTNYILYEFFSIRRVRKDESDGVIKPHWGVIFGFIPAIIGFFTSLELIILIMAIMVFVVVAFISPEFPLLFTILSLPYVSLLPKSEIIFALLSALTLLSFFRKVILGKRVYYFEIYDVCLFLLLVVFFISGVIGGGTSSTANAWIMIALILGYIPASNLILNRRLADCAANSIIFSAFPLSIMAIVQYIVALAGGNHAPSTAIFDGVAELSMFLLVSAIFCIFFIPEKRNKRTGKILYSISLFFNVAAIITTENIILLPVLIAVVLAYGVLNSPKLVNLLSIPLAFMPLLVFLLPDAVLVRTSEIFGITPVLIERFADIKESINLFLDNLPLGIGANGLIVSDEYPTFNLITGIACRFGVVALLLFVAILVLRLLHLSSYSAFYKNSSVGPLVNMSSLSIYCFIVFGMFYDLFSHTSLFCLFWSMLGICSATLRISKSAFDDYVSYYSDLSRFDSADASIILATK